MNSRAKNYALSPKRYFAFDISIADCAECGWGKLYQTCKICRNASSCEGFAVKDGEYEKDCCCNCYVNKTKEEVK